MLRIDHTTTCGTLMCKAFSFLFSSHVRYDSPSVIIWSIHNRFTETPSYFNALREGSDSCFVSARVTERVMLFFLRDIGCVNDDNVKTCRVCSYTYITKHRCALGVIQYPDDDIEL